MNLYAYAGNNPVSFSDPFGLCEDPDDPKCKTMLQTVNEAVDGFFNSLAGQALAATAAAAQVIGGALDFFFPGTTDVSHALIGRDQDGNKLGISGSLGLMGKAGAKLGISAAIGAGVGAIGSLGGEGARFVSSRAGHIFRDAPGHVNPVSASSQGRFARLFESVALNGTRNDAIISSGARKIGVRGFTQDFRGGQVWVGVRENQIVNAGVNRW